MLFTYIITILFRQILIQIYVIISTQPTPTYLLFTCTIFIYLYFPQSHTQTCLYHIPFLLLTHHTYLFLLRTRSSFALFLSPYRSYSTLLTHYFFVLYTNVRLYFYLLYPFFITVFLPSPSDTPPFTQSLSILFLYHQ